MLTHLTNVLPQNAFLFVHNQQFSLKFGSEYQYYSIFFPPDEGYLSWKQTEIGKLLKLDKPVGD